MPSRLTSKLKLGSSSAPKEQSGSASVSSMSAAKSTAKSIKSALSLKKKKKSTSDSAVSDYDDGGFGEAGEDAPGSVGFGSAAPRFGSPKRKDPDANATKSVVSGAKSKAISILRTPKIKAAKSSGGDDDSDPGFQSAVPGDYLVIVHIIEVRDLKPADPGGSADPFVSVKVNFGKQKKDAVTRVMKEDRNATFDETFRFEFSNCSIPDVEMSMITVTVRDSDLLSKDEDIGVWEADLFDGVYSRHDHEYYRQFVVLTSTDESDSSAQGFLRLSVTMLGPGDRMPFHNVTKERQQEQLGSDDLLSPMGGLGSTELRFIKVDVHEIINVPYYKFEYAKRLFIQAELGRIVLRTNVAESEFVPTATGVSPFQKKRNKTSIPTRKFIINERMNIAVIHPTMARLLRLSIWESRSSKGHGNSRCLAYLDEIRIDSIKLDPTNYQHVTLPFYGAPLLSHKHLKGGNGVTSKMNHSPDFATTYRGQLVVSVKDSSPKGKEPKSYCEPLEETESSDSHSGFELDSYGLGGPQRRGGGEEEEGDEKLNSQSQHSTSSSYEEERKIMEQLFTLKAQILWGCNLPTVPDGGNGSDLKRTLTISSSSTPTQFGVRISCGKHYLETGLMTPRGWGENTSGDMCDWRSSGIRSFTFGSPLRPSHSEHVDDENDEYVDPPRPDIIVTLLRGHSQNLTGAIMDKKPPIPICYRRIPSSELLIPCDQEQEEAPKPKANWIHLKEDKSVDALHDTVFPGSILVRMGLYPCGKNPIESKSEPSNNSALGPRWEGEMPYDDISTIVASPNIVTPSCDDFIGVDVRVNVYTAQDLPPADQSTGALDPYLICSLGGMIKRTSTKNDTRNPSWFETLAFHAYLPRSRELWPQLILQLWDQDEASDDDFVGNLILSLNNMDGGGDQESGIENCGGHSEIPPQWKNIFFQEPGDIKQGSVLLGVECTVHEKESTDSLNGDDDDEVKDRDVATDLPSELDMKKSVKPSNRRKAQVTTEKFLPLGSERTVEFIALGCRGLHSPSSVYDMKKPMALFRIGDSATVSTPPSNRPSAKNCNFNVKLQIPNVYLPDDYELAPFLQVKILDGSVKVKGFSKKESVENGKRIVGTGCISLKNLQYYQNLRLSAGSSNAEALPSESDSDSSNDVSIVDAQKLITRSYNQGRQVLEGELEVQPIYDTIKIYRGKPNNESETSRYDLEEVGRLYVFARIIDPNDSITNTSTWDLVMKQLTTPTRYDLHVYILKGKGLPSLDKNGKSDPYVRLRIGDNNGRNDWVVGKVHNNVANPEFFQRFDFACKIPGDNLIEIQVLDQDESLFDSRDDLIGSTRIEITNRVFSKQWREYGIHKPIEHRQLWNPTSRQPQGLLQMWVDAVEQTNKTFPVWDINQPPSQEFEVRIVVWKVQDIPPGDDFTDQSDLFVKMKLGDHDWRETDTHYFAKNGRGSFNYRIKFPVELGEGGKIRGEGASKLKIQVWDADILFNDILCTTQMNLGRAFQNAWIMKDTGLGYQHLGNVEEQLKIAAKREGRNQEDYSEERMRDIPTNWRHDPDGFLSGDAEKYENEIKSWYTPTEDDFDCSSVVEMEVEEGKAEGKEEEEDNNELSMGYGEALESERTGEEEPLLISGLKNITHAEYEAIKKRQRINKKLTEKIVHKTYGATKTVTKTVVKKPHDVIKDTITKKKKKKLSPMNQFRETMGLKTPENSKWISFPVRDLESGELKKTDAKILLSIEIVPKKLANLRKNGEGQDGPNAYPFLPPPEGRVEIGKMLYNPLYALKVCLGDTIGNRVGAGCCCILSTAAFLFIVYFIGPDVMIILQVISMVPPIVAHIILGVILFLIAFACAYCSYKFGTREVEEDAEEYLEDELDP